MNLKFLMLNVFLFNLSERIQKLKRQHWEIKIIYNWEIKKNVLVKSRLLIQYIFYELFFIQIYLNLDHFLYLSKTNLGLDNLVKSY